MTGERHQGRPRVADIARAGRITVYELFLSRVRKDPSAMALKSASVERSYGELDERVRKLAAALSAKGIERGDRVVLVSENRAEYAEMELACAFLGAILACQNWRLAADELQHCINLVAPRLIVSSRRFAYSVESLSIGDVPQIVIEDDYEAMLAAAAPADYGHAVDPEDGLVILYTSGTTGMPKGALISHRAEIARMAALRLDLRATDEDGFVAWAPMFHMGSTDQVFGALMSGATVFICDGYDAEAIVSIIEDNLIGWMILMPGTIEPVIEALKRRGKKPKGIRAIGAMADLVPTKLIAELTALSGAPYLNSFGATETGLPPATGDLIPPGVVPAGLSKKKSSLCEFRLVDAEGRDVPDGEPGEAAVRGPTVFSGYWNADDTNARDFKDGWFRMGDLFRKNPDGSYDFVDRAKYMIKSGGENIYPAEIERVLLADPRVADAVVVRKRDDRWGEVPVAFVARNDETLGEAEIERLCRAALAGYKRPKEIRFVAFEDFPRSTTGKILRHEMERLL